ncbi:hypothetical protein HDV02_001345 [Globomyces sp. JEL0801]|nr:hypothetical protein HDV02_001345 [Globomyces sp. JEL0801]
MNSAFPQSGHAFVKSILSGDSVVIRLKPQGGPPPELAFSLSNIVSPRLASKNLENEEDFAFESKEFLREFLIGKEVVYKIEYQSASNRAYGTLKVQHPINNETIVNRIVVAAGWAKVKSSDPKRGSGE